MLFLVNAHHRGKMSVACLCNCVRMHGGKYRIYSKYTAKAVGVDAETMLREDNIFNKM